MTNGTPRTSSARSDPPRSADDLTDPAHTAGSRSRSWIRWAAIGLIAALVGAVMGWALATILNPPADVLDANSFTTVEVVQGELTASSAVNTVAVWRADITVANRATGVVTSVLVTAGQEVGQGSALYTVDLRPVSAAVGEVPAFRDLATGTAGEDVAQLQSMLQATGFYDGVADGEFGPATRAAVQAWQTSIGVEADGVVALGDVVFLPALPTKIALDDRIIAVSNTVGGGEAAISALGAAPTFTIPATESQASSMPLGTRVEIQAPDGSLWTARVADQVPDESEGSVSVVLASEGTDSICGGQCGLLPADGESLLRSQVVTLEPVAGLIVPTAAILTRADGSTALVTADGDQLDITIVAGARGQTIVQGAVAGLRVRVPAGD